MKYNKKILRFIKSDKLDKLIFTDKQLAEIFNKIEECRRHLYILKLRKRKNYKGIFYDVTYTKYSDFSLQVNLRI
jgi:hypothetical protein